MIIKIAYFIVYFIEMLISYIFSITSATERNQPH